jgi:hypothetical protein
LVLPLGDRHGCTTLVSAHNVVDVPKTEFKTTGRPSGWTPGNWIAEFSPPFSGDVSTGASFMALAKKAGFSTARAFLEKRGAECGYSNVNVKAKAIPKDSVVRFSRAMAHAGPCELWIDNKMVYHNDDCELNWKGGSTVKIDFSSCKTKCVLRWYWLGLQASGRRMQSYSTLFLLCCYRRNVTSTNWSVVENCIPLARTSTRSMDEYDFSDLATNGTDSSAIDA